MTEKSEIVFLDQTVDQVATSCLVLPFFSDEKPLKGLNGMVDWRLNGQISRQLIAQHILGIAEETVLIPHPGRILAENIVMLGLGEERQLDGRIFEACLLRLHHVLSKARVADYVFAMNALVNAAEQALWLEQFVRKNAIPRWKVLAPKG